MTRREQVDVLIVGGGGAGLTAAMLLARMEVDALLVSSLPTTSILPKAHVLGQRAMEVLDDCGCADAVYAVGTPPEQLSHTAFYAGFAGHPDAGRILYRQECWGGGGADPDWVAASPKLTTNLPQLRLEPIMKAQADALAPGRIRFHHEVTALIDDPDRVVATVVDRDTGEEYEVAARWVIAADGGRTIGRIVGVTMEGLTDLTRTATLHFSADLSAWAKDPEVLLRWVWCPSVGKLVVLAPMGPTRWGGESEEWVGHLNYDIDDERAFDDDAVIADVRAALGIGDHPLDVHLVTRWTIGGVVADRFRCGRVLVTGDAAHRHPPTGGLGLTSAIHDAQNLCWKIAHVVRGLADESLLDSYEVERRPVDARNVHRSLENALGYPVISEAMGFEESASADERWAAVARVWSDEPADRDHRRTVIELMAAQSQEFHEQDVEYGYSHRSDAVVPDGSPEPAPHDFRMFVPSTRPGEPLPHAWLEDEDFERCSTLDLVPIDRFVLIAGEEGEAWCEAARKAATDLGVGLDAYRIGHSRGDLRDPRLRWARVRGIDADGAILVRPDRCVAFRSAGAVADPEAAVRGALARILGRAA
jgi:2,4-dichlorophenol 6-monooxygenase